MRVQAVESGYVRARRRDVHPLLRDVAGYGRWWPGVTVEPAGDVTALTLAGRGRLSRPQRVLVRISEVRPDLGVRLSCAGDVRGEAEWYYLDERAGIVVSYALRAEIDARGGPRRLAAHRARVRAALFALADLTDGDRRVAAEPSARLLADQRAASAAFRRSGTSSPAVGDDAHTRRSHR